MINFTLYTTTEQDNWLLLQDGTVVYEGVTPPAKLLTTIQDLTNEDFTIDIQTVSKETIERLSE